MLTHIISILRDKMCVANIIAYKNADATAFSLFPFTSKVSVSFYIYTCIRLKKRLSDEEHLVFLTKDFIKTHILTFYASDVCIHDAPFIFLYTRCNQPSTFSWWGILILDIFRRVLKEPVICLRFWFTEDVGELWVSL